MDQAQTTILIFYGCILLAGVMIGLIGIWVTDNWGD